jgi:hypothetical protein
MVFRSLIGATLALGACALADRKNDQPLVAASRPGPLIGPGENAARAFDSPFVRTSLGRVF